MTTLEGLHSDLLAGNLRAASKIVESALPAMVRVARAMVPGLYNDHEEACLDALLQYLQNPAVYDPSRSKLLTYLVMKAKSRAKTDTRAQSRRQKYEAAFAMAQETQRDAEDEILAIISWREVKETHLAKLCESNDEEEVFFLIAAGERFAEAYLDALSLQDTPENRVAVERMREKIRGRIRRLRPQLVQ